jgi:hypothetical protein
MTKSTVTSASKTKAAKVRKLHPFQKVLTIMIDGQPTMLDKIDALLGKEIFMYRISTYMWHIKTNANGVIRPIKDGRKVIGYQLCNVAEVTEYMKRNGVPTTYVQKQPAQPTVAPEAVTALSDLKAEPVAKKTKTAKKAETTADMEVTEVTTNE